MYSKLQLENPISSALAMPGSEILRTLSFHDSDIRDMPENDSQLVVQTEMLLKLIVLESD